MHKIYTRVYGEKQKSLMSDVRISTCFHNQLNLTFYLAFLPAWLTALKVHWGLHLVVSSNMTKGKSSGKWLIFTYQSLYARRGVR